MITALQGKLNGFKHAALLKNFFAYCLSEAGSKISRLIAVIAMARVLEIEAIGAVAAALAIGEIFKSLTENGVGQKIIASSDEELDAVCNSAHRIFWVWCSGLFLAQIAFAWMFYSLWESQMTALMIALLAIEYLFMPAGLVSCALAMRAGKLKGTALISGVQNVGANLSTGALVFLWASPLAVIIPKLIMAPIWLIGMRRLHPWSVKKGIAPAPYKPILTFGGFVLGVELLKALRLQADKLIVGAILGAEALGIYYFAVNAGLGIAISFAFAFSTVIYPFFCNTQEKTKSFLLGNMLAVSAVTPIVLAQALLAPIYVPLIFGDKWSSVTALVTILCFAAIPTLIWATTSQWLRANGQPHKDFVYSIGISAIILAATAISARFGLTAVAWGFLGAAIFSQIGAAIFVFFKEVSNPSFEPAHSHKDALQGV